MNASSQNPSGDLPPESPYGPRPLPTPAGVFAAYGAVLPVPAGSAPAARRPAATADPDVPDSLAVVAAAGLIGPVMEKEGVTAREVARAEEQAGLLFDPERAEAIADAAYRLGVDDTKAERAELALLGQDPETLAWFHTRLNTVAALCAGRRPEDLLTVREVLTAADGRQSSGAPLTITWDGSVTGLTGDTPYEDTVVPCTTVRGGPAALVLDDSERLALGGLLLASLHTAEACQTKSCGRTAEEIDESNPFVSGWICVKVAGTDGPARWWCSVWCANSAITAITAGGAELAAADLAAAVDPNAQAPYEVRVDGSEPHRFEPERLGESDATRRPARCRHCPGARTDAIHIWADDDQAAVGGGL